MSQMRSRRMPLVVLTKTKPFSLPPGHVGLSIADLGNTWHHRGTVSVGKTARLRRVVVPRLQNDGGTAASVALDINFATAADLYLADEVALWRDGYRWFRWSRGTLLSTVAGFIINRENDQDRNGHQTCVIAEHRPSIEKYGGQRQQHTITLAARRSASVAASLAMAARIWSCWVGRRWHPLCGRPTVRSVKSKSLIMGGEGGSPARSRSTAAGPSKARTLGSARSMFEVCRQCYGRACRAPEYG